MKFLRINTDMILCSFAISCVYVDTWGNKHITVIIDGPDGSSFLAQLTLCGLLPSTIHFHISIFCKIAELNGTKLGRNIHFLE